jgi:transposase
MQNAQDTYQKNQVVSIEEYQKLKQVNSELEAELLYHKQELAQLKRMIYGSKSERYVAEDTGQLSFEMDVAQQEAPKQETEEITYKRKKTGKKKNNPVRLPLPSHLHREEIVIEPQEDIAGAKKIGEEITEVLDYIPGKFYVEKYIRPKYALEEDRGVVIGELPTLPIPKGNAGAGLLSHLLISKFVDHLPFYRQVQQFKRENITIAESTISGWFTAACRLLLPLYDTLVEKIQQCDYLMADETPIPVQTSNKPGSTHKGYHWVYYSPLDKLVCFDYKKTRGRDGPKAFLKDFTGALQTDGYNAYNIFEAKEYVTLLACMAHARRKFEHALDNDPKRAEYAMEKIQALYRIEKEARESNLSHEQRKTLRQEKAKPILQEFEQWMKEQLPEVLPKSMIGKAINYTMGLWNRLIRYIDDGKWEIDNNLVENSIRPVALGRKNYLFAGSHEAAKQAAMIYSFLGTCKLNNVEPFQWLKETLSRIPDQSIQKLDELLPGFKEV